MNGQPRLAALIALDLLAAAGIGVCYAGDLDPEGLLIGQKLADYYPGAFCFVGMRAEDYRQSMSQESISNRRLKMLERITHPQLAEAAELMRQYRRAGYQELLIQKSNFGILKYRDVCVGGEPNEHDLETLIFQYHIKARRGLLPKRRCHAQKNCREFEYEDLLRAGDRALHR